MFTNCHGVLTVLVLIVLQKVEVVFKKAAADHEKFKASLAKEHAEPQFLQNMQKELQEIDSEILQLEQDR